MLYKKEIDGLRAIAVLAVIFYHAGYSLFKGGFIGVDIFFVISGYLITSNLLSEVVKNNFSMKLFLERRLRRILPALFIVTLIVLILGWWILFPREMKSLSESAVATISLVSNIYFKRNSGYFDENSDLKPLLHTWSLGVEAQFYFLFPPLFIYIINTTKSNPKKLLLFCIMISFLLSQWAALTKPTSAFFLLWSRLWELLIGAYLAATHSSTPTKIRTDQSTCLSTLGFILIILPVVFYDDKTIFPGAAALAPTIGAALTIKYSDQNTFTGRIIGSKYLVGVGLISYSAYLWHQPLFAFLRNHQHVNFDSYRPLLIIIIFPLAYLSWKYIELPFRNKHFLKSKYFLSLTTFTFVLIFSIATISIRDSGFSSRSFLMEKHSDMVGNDDFYNRLASFPLCKNLDIQKDSLKFKEILRCRQSNTSNKVDIALVGDSHAEHLFIGLAEALRSYNIALYLNNTFPFVSESDYKKINQSITESSSIQTVVMGVQWMRWNSKGNLHEKIIETIAPYIKSGKRVILMADIPIFPFSAEHCKYELTNIRDHHCQHPSIYFSSKQSYFNSELLIVKERIPQVILVPLTPLFCDQNNCSMVSGAHLLYRDEGHLNLSGSRYVANNLLLDYFNK